MFVAEFRKDSRNIMHTTVKLLEDGNRNVRDAAIKPLSRLAVQSTYYHQFPVGVLRHVCS